MPALAILGSVDIHKLVPNLLSNGAAGGEFPSVLVNLRDVIGNLVPKFIRARASWSGVTGGDGTSTAVYRVFESAVATVPPPSGHQAQLLVKPLSISALDSPTISETLFSTASPGASPARGALWFLGVSNSATPPGEVLPITGPFIGVQCTNPGVAYAATGIVTISLDFIG
jgi:hypothetical protein